MRFSDFLFEASLPTKFKINLKSKETDIFRDYHVRQPRGNSKIPRDSGMSIKKYEKILNLGIDKIDASNTFTLTWTKNSKSFAISGNIEDDTIVIFGAIMGRKEDPSKLYRLKGTNRYHIGEVTFN